jgi:hypothetical protein
MSGTIAGKARGLHRRSSYRSRTAVQSACALLRTPVFISANTIKLVLALLLPISGAIDISKITYFGCSDARKIFISHQLFT